MMLIIQFALAMLLAYGAGIAVKYLKLPPIIGWLIMAMFLGQYGLNLLNQSLISHPIYLNLTGFSQLLVGSMVGYTLVYSELKDKIKQVLIIGLSDIVVTFIVVTVVFVIVLYFLNLPIIAAVLFGAIATATAPAPPIALIQQYRCKGPLSDSIAPMTALNGVMINLLFFPLVAIIGAMASGNQGSLLLDLTIVVLVPILIGLAVGFIFSKLVGADNSATKINILYTVMFLLLFLLTSYLNKEVFLTAKMMTILTGISAAAMFVNGIKANQIKSLHKSYGPIHNYVLMFFIVNLSSHLNPLSLLSGGVVMVIYIVARAIGKYSGCYLGAKISQAPQSVCRGMGIVVQPHSGVSIMLAGISALTLAPINSEVAALLQVTISAAALVIELISLPLSKVVYEKNGEIPEIAKT